jgi:hypothetical protein
MRRCLVAVSIAAALLIAGCASPEQKTQKAYERVTKQFDQTIAKCQSVEDESSATLTQMKMKQNEVWAKGKKAHDDVKVLKQLRSFADNIKNSGASVDQKQQQFKELTARLEAIGKN